MQVVAEAGHAFDYLGEKLSAIAGFSRLGWIMWRYN
jgi:hypothetical protein